MPNQNETSNNEYSPEFRAEVKKARNRMELSFGFCVVVLFSRHLLALCFAAVAAYDSRALIPATVITEIALFVLLVCLILMCISTVRLSRLLKLSRVVTVIMAGLCFLIGIVPLIYMHVQSNKVLQTQEQKQTRMIFDELMRKQISKE